MNTKKFSAHLNHNLEMTNLEFLDWLMIKQLLTGKQSNYI